MALPLPDIADQWTRVGVEIAATLLLAGAAAAVAFTTGRRVAIC